MFSKATHEKIILNNGLSKNVLGSFSYFTSVQLTVLLCQIRNLVCKLDKYRDMMAGFA